jgi:hypothetical protein
MADGGKMLIGKLDAARRQLHAAIKEWFCGGDPVVTHTLACAAYEIIHAISLHRNPNRRDLLFDTDNIKDEYRKEWKDHLRKPANFFKHADRDGDSVIEFDPRQSDGFIMFSILGLSLCRERSHPFENTWIVWAHIQNPKLLTEKGRKAFAENIPVESLNEARVMSRDQLFHAYCAASHRIVTGHAPTSRQPSYRRHSFPLSARVRGQ